MSILPPPDSLEKIEDYVVGLWSQDPRPSDEAIHASAKEQHRATLEDPHAELMFLQRAERFDAMPAGSPTNSRLLMRYQELLPMLLARDAMPWVEAHRKVLRQAFLSATDAGDYDVPWRPHSPKRWAEQVDVKTSTVLPEGSLSRQQLVDRLETTSDPAAAATMILAWGGMKINSARRLFGPGNEAWLDLIDPMRTGAWSRSEAYEQFAARRATGLLPGMGPAYFTKLIFFLLPAGRENLSRGYIMDQWTACSINLLFEHELIKLDKIYPKGLRVSDANTPGIYERFNLLIEHIAHQWRQSGDAVEMALFDRGRPRQGEWRLYCEKNRRHHWR